LTYEVVSNTSVVNVDNDVGEDLELYLDGQPVSNVRLHVIKVQNAGNQAILPDDYPNKLRFAFLSPPFTQPLIRCGIHRTEPPNMLPSHHLKDLVSIDTPDQTAMIFKPPLLNKRDAVYLKVLLQANNRESTSMSVIGQIREGTIKKYTSNSPRVTRRVVIVGVLAAFVLGLLIPNAIALISAFAHDNCAVGSIQVSGSTSFYNTVYQEAKKYNQLCPIASITVNQSSSGTGLDDLENNRLSIADSELVAPANVNLQDNRVAVIVFALVANKNIGPLTNLDTAQIRAIYSGQDTYWDQVDPSLRHLPIKVIGRPDTSGTHATFVSYVLGGSEPPLPVGATTVDRSSEVVSMVASTSGAIGYADFGDAINGSVTILDINQYAPSAPLIEKGLYPFWAIEHMYTGKNPPPLATSFITYVEQDLQTKDTFVSLSQMPASVLATRP
jgi:phosphate transport system substrate-binding protein